jgi:radical SAM superfamily enzyme with C-terminal helix-hairpin-helix motif
MAGAIKAAGCEYRYLTVEQWRKRPSIDGDVLVVIAGAVVPGRYLRGMPLSLRECERICSSFTGTTILTGACARYGFGRGGGRPPKPGNDLFDYAAQKDGDAFVFDLINGKEHHRYRTVREWQKWCVFGSEVVTAHPDHPQTLIAEIETYRGCVRWRSGGCLFCTEPSFGRPLMRDEEDVIKEVRALADKGVRNFRLGGQSCFFSYKAQGIGTYDAPKPQPAAIEHLLRGVVKAASPMVLHIDNVNPAVVAAWPEESLRIAELIVRYCTAGNTAALGMETADESVVAYNNLNAMPEDVVRTVELLNRAGGARGDNGMPAFLPGINFLFGLQGETKETFQKNYAFLEGIVKKNLLLRRINIRQVVWFDGIRNEKHVHELKKFKAAVNDNIRRVLLERLVPPGLVLSRVCLELQHGNNTFGRQIGSYPLLVHIPYRCAIGRFVNVRVLATSFKSVQALEYPLDINSAPLTALSALPSVGRKRAARIVKSRPITSVQQLMQSMDNSCDIAVLVPWIRPLSGGNGRTHDAVP